MVLWLLLCPSPAFAADPPPPADPPNLTMEGLDEVEILGAVARHDPTYHQRLLVLRDQDPVAYTSALTRVAQQIRRAKEDPAVMARVLAIRQKTQEIEALAMEWADLPAADRPARRAALETLASSLMDLKQADRRARLDALRERIASLQAEIDQREADRESIVEAFVDRVLDGPVDL